jgi:hypothetical protein
LKKIATQCFLGYPSDFTGLENASTEPRRPCTDKKENKTFLILYIRKFRGIGCKSYMTNGLLIYDEIFARFLIIRKPFLIYDFAPADHI